MDLAGVLIIIKMPRFFRDNSTNQTKEWTRGRKPKLLMRYGHSQISGSAVRSDGDSQETNNSTNKQVNKSNKSTHKQVNKQKKNQSIKASFYDQLT